MNLHNIGHGKSAWVIETTQLMRERGYHLLRSPDMLKILNVAGSQDWISFADSWNDLGPDEYMADGGRYRRRRFSSFAISGDVATLKPPQGHFQTRQHNSLNGGILRMFEPIRKEIATHSIMLTILQACNELFNGLSMPRTGYQTWHAEVHQFRIEATLHEEGKPTPEGAHQDGVDWVFILLINRFNVRNGVTTIFSDLKQHLVDFTLTDAMDACFLDDNRVYHGVTPVSPLDPAKAGYRDVLVVTFRRSDEQI